MFERMTRVEGVMSFVAWVLTLTLMLAVVTECVVAQDPVQGLEQEVDTTAPLVTTICQQTDPEKVELVPIGSGFGCVPSAPEGHEWKIADTEEAQELLKAFKKVIANRMNGLCAFEQKALKAWNDATAAADAARETCKAEAEPLLGDEKLEAYEVCDEQYDRAVKAAGGALSDAYDDLSTALSYVVQSTEDFYCLLWHLGHLQLVDKGQAVQLPIALQMLGWSG